MNFSGCGSGTGTACRGTLGSLATGIDDIARTTSGDFGNARATFCLDLVLLVCLIAMHS